MCRCDSCTFSAQWGISLTVRKAHTDFPCNKILFHLSMPVIIDNWNPYISFDCHSSSLSGLSVNAGVSLCYFNFTLQKGNQFIIDLLAAVALRCTSCTFVQYTVGHFTFCKKRSFCSSRHPFQQNSLFHLNHSYNSQFNPFTKYRCKLFQS